MARCIDSVKHDPKRCIKEGDKEGWVIAKGMKNPLKWRIKDAWGVLIGKYEAFWFHGHGGERV
jgi:hypothetical protein